MIRGHDSGIQYLRNRVPMVKSLSPSVIRAIAVHIGPPGWPVLSENPNNIGIVRYDQLPYSIFAWPYPPDMVSARVVICPDLKLRSRNGTPGFAIQHLDGDGLVRLSMQHAV